MKVRLWIDGEPCDYENVEEVEFLTGAGFDVKMDEGRLQIKPQEVRDVSVQ